MLRLERGLDTTAAVMTADDDVLDVQHVDRYWIADRQFRSVCTATLAMLRCTNTSPGRRPTIWLAGTRLSAQPMHM